MSLYKNASLVMIPSAYKDGKLYSIRPTDGSGDFTFSRGSNLAATRVDVNGLIEKGRENLLLQSNQFDTTWASPDCDITGGQSDKDGGTNAWLLTATGAFNRIVQSISQSGVKRFSVYAKADTNNYLLLGCFEGAHFYATFNLATGVVDSNNINAISPSIEDVGNGWYRCSATWIGATTDVRIASQATSGQGGWATTTSGSIYIQDAQLEQSMVATDYIETGASTAQAGILEDMPRLDYSGGASCPALLLEPQRTNFVTDSEYFENYTKTDSSVTSNSAISPEGLENATKLFDGTGSAQHYIGNVGIGYFTNTDIRGTSVFVKAGTLDYMQLRLTNFGGTFSYYLVNVNLNNGSVSLENSSGTTNLSNSVEDYGNGWYRVSIACSFTNSNVTGSRTEIYTAKNNNHTYTGTGTDYILIYGAQAESGSYPTSYIPTYGSSVTRSGDNSGAIDVSSLGVTTGYTLFYELGDFNVAFGGVWLAQAGGVDRAYQVYGATAVIKTNSGDAYPFNHGTLGEGTGIKVAVNYDGTNINVFTNGTKRGTWAANKTIWDALTNLDMNLSSVQMVNWKQLLVFPTALTDSECIALTTL